MKPQYEVSFYEFQQCLDMIKGQLCVNKDLRIISKEQGMRDGNVFDYISIFIGNEESYQKVLKIIGLTPQPNPVFPMTLIADLGMTLACLDFYSSAQSVGTLIETLTEEHKEELKRRTGGVVIAEILEGDPDSFAVDVSKITYIGKILNSDRNWGYSFVITSPGSERLRPEFRSKDSAEKARNELIQLFKER